jgi:hypothetical protein
MPAAAMVVAVVMPVVIVLRLLKNQLIHLVGNQLLLLSQPMDSPPSKSLHKNTPPPLSTLYHLSLLPLDNFLIAWLYKIGKFQTQRQRERN